MSDVGRALMKGLTKRCEETGEKTIHFDSLDVMRDEISGLSGCSKALIREALGVLRRIGMLSFERPKLDQSRADVEPGQLGWVFTPTKL